MGTQAKEGFVGLAVSCEMQHGAPADRFHIEALSAAPLCPTDRRKEKAHPHGRKAAMGDEL